MSLLGMTTTSSGNFPHPSRMVVLEDDSDFQEDIEKFFIGKGFDTNSESEYDNFIDCMKLIDWDIGMAIIDLHLGKDKPRGGMNAVKAIRKNKPQTFVVLYTGHGCLLSEDSVDKSKADIIVNKSDLQKDLNHIHDEYSKHVRSQLEKIILSVDNPNDSGYEDEMSEDDPRSKNRLAFQKMLSDEAWYEKHEGKYVAIVDGNFLDENDNENLLITNVLKDQDSRVLVAKVESEEPVQLLSPFYFKID